MTTEPRYIPEQIAHEIERYADNELDQFAKYTNREPFDKSGVYGIRRLVASAYAAGFEAGERSEYIRINGADRRRDERKRAETESETS